MHLNNNMYWVCIQYIVKKFPDGLFLVTPYVPIRDFLFEYSSPDITWACKYTGRKCVNNMGDIMYNCSEKKIHNEFQLINITELY